MNRQFRMPASNRLRASDFTYVATWKGFVYVGHVDGDERYFVHISILLILF
ncbi:hypothetical protein [Paracoccus liaowanqingii]|uniref:hypothetical protein n=1 Tax=Paracoccus liaowanqingii TaxID=2560053 RepID=UPI00143D5FBD|nr:hypothetical protein [Paracoccus liaowanqingii]